MEQSASAFAQNKKLGILVGGTYDFNGRGINDIEPVPPTSSANPHYDSMDLRDYIYYRTRWGMTASADYKLSEGSDISLRGLFSTFRNWGNKWVYTLNDGDVPGYSQDWRRPNMAIFSLALQGKHVFNASTINWGGAFGRSRSLSGSGSVKYSWVGDPDIDCTNVEGVSVYRPGWSSGCFGPGTDNAEDPNNYKLKSFAPPTFGKSAQAESSGFRFLRAVLSRRQSFRHDSSLAEKFVTRTNSTIPTTKLHAERKDPGCGSSRMAQRLHRSKLLRQDLPHWPGHRLQQGGKLRVRQPHPLHDERRTRSQCQ